MAKEQFRDWTPSGELKVSYKDAHGSDRIWKANQAELLESVQKIIEEFQRQSIRLTNRQTYYQLVAANIIPNADKVYKRICVFLTDARYGGYIDWDAIEDRGRVAHRHSEWENVKNFMGDVVHAFRLPRWSDQECYVELFTEKQAVESVLSPLADKYHIHFGYNKGYSSAAMMYELSKRIVEQIYEGKKVKLLYAGDHDASGLDMIRDINERIIEFLIKGDDAFDISRVEEYFEIIPLALNMEQIRQYNPPPNPAKALALNTPLPTPSGWTTIQDVKVGDRLFSDDGSVCKVIKKSPIFQNKDCYEFTFSCGERIISSSDHLWKVDGRKRSKINDSIKTTLQIASSWNEGKDKRPVYRIHTAKPLDLPEVDLPIPPYTLGAWLGDGFSEGYGFACSEKDTEILGYIKNDGFGVKRYDKIRCGISGLCKYLRKEGLFMNKYIPNHYLRSSFKQRLELLQGLMDTDGTASDPLYRTKDIESVACSFGSSKKHLAEQVLELLVSLGIKGNLSESRAVLMSKDYGSAWRVEFYPGDMDVFRLVRKRKRLAGSRINIRQMWRTIINVEKVSSVPTQCLVVDAKDNLFLAGKQMIPTHNSTDPRAKWYIEKYGNSSWELDALRPEVLRDIVERGVQENLDIEKYNAWIAREKPLKQKLQDFADSLVGEENE